MLAAITAETAAGCTVYFVRKKANHALRLR